MNDQTTERSKRIALALSSACLLVGIGLLVWISHSTPPPAAQITEPPTAVQPQAVAEPEANPVTEGASASPLEKQWGLQVLGLSLTNNDTAVQVRYTVVNPEKTLLLAETNAMAYLISQANGTKLPMIALPEEGAVSQGANMRTIRRMMKQAGQFPPAPSRLIAGRTYSLEIPNWGLTLRSGSIVSLVVGELRQDNLTVE